MTESREIIFRFGGVAALAGLLGKPPSTIRNWVGDGIPGIWHSRLLALARERDVFLTFDELLETTRK